jgi:hypothetical protein
VIAPSPRVEFALAGSPDQVPEHWREFRPRPTDLPVSTMLRRLLWNPRWNESLFVVSCAERLMDQPTDHSRDEIFKRIAADLARLPQGDAAGDWLSFRLVFVSREDETVSREELYRSEPRRLADIAIR